ncbi:hypothetical protein [Flavobacterium psychraquaticum]|uniref:hypothetical protein n=1 Tax=Flavobacterium psychraquaticum TaxID=3103958 RepID=UPI002ACDCA0F|nr:hypothetical protein [Flavobacterium sp. LB-N7T]
MQNGSNNFEIEILKRASLEIDEISEYYESLVDGLGTKFYIELSFYIETLHYIPFFEKKYKLIRVLPLKKFPYSIHFSVNESEKIVEIHAVTCDYQNPETLKIK